MAEARYQVFVSSTYTDLVDERRAVMSALLQLGAFPAGMELFPAADDEAWTLIQRVIDESDYYLLIVGGRYGSVSEEGLSFTEKEYDYALQQRKPVMAFVHGNPDAIPVGKSEVTAEARTALETFIAKVKKAKHIKTWTSAEDLSGKIALSFTTFVRTYPSPGWVPGDSGDSATTLAALARAQQRIAELEAIASHSSSHAPPGTEGLASGNDRYPLFCHVGFEITNLNSYSRHKEIWTEVRPSWDELFADLGPLMMFEAEEAALLDRQSDALFRIGYESMHLEVSDWCKANVPKSELRAGAVATFQLRNAHADPTGAETVLLQFQALGLIEQSQRNRSVRDKGTYWSLTPWGRHRLTQLRAVKKGETGPSAAPDSEQPSTKG